METKKVIGLGLLAGLGAAYWVLYQKKDEKAEKKAWTSVATVSKSRKIPPPGTPPQLGSKGVGLLMSIGSLSDLSKKGRLPAGEPQNALAAWEKAVGRTGADFRKWYMSVTLVDLVGVPPTGVPPDKLAEATQPLATTKWAPLTRLLESKGLLGGIDYGMPADFGYLGSYL